MHPFSNGSANCKNTDTDLSVVAKLRRSRWGIRRPFFIDPFFEGFRASGLAFFLVTLV